MRALRYVSASTALLLSARGDAQRPTTTVPRSVHGVVVARGVPLSLVNVFDLETLEGTLTDSSGRFRIAVADSTRRTVRVTARRVGFRPVDTTVTIADSVVLRLQAITDLAVITVQAGQYTSSAERTATLTPLEVATTPGTNADVLSAIKTLPGVQNADEGNGVFVHGGDATETRTFVDGAPLFSPYQVEAPTGSVAGTINPFLLDRITFSSGGFGAMWGNALSGIVDLRTQGRPAASFVNGNASIIGAAVSGGLSLNRGLGVAATLSASDLTALLAMNGNPRAFAPAPRGGAVSGTAAWQYRSRGVVKVFALRQDNRLGIPVADAGFDDTFSSARTSDVAVASWRSESDARRSSASVSTSGLRREEAFGAYRQESTLRTQHAGVESTVMRGERLAVTGGAELEHQSAHIFTRFPLRAYDRSPSAPTFVSQSAFRGVRGAAFVSVDTRPWSTVQLVVGLRSDRSAFATRQTIDPRLSMAWAVRPAVTVTAAWGDQHQTVDPALLDRVPRRAPVPAVHSRMAIGGVQFGDGAALLRIEAWSRRYDSVVALTRDYMTVAGLRGSASGVDLFARHDGPWKSRWRATYSAAQSRRTDPNTLHDAAAPFDVPHTVTVVSERAWSGGWSASAAWRFASGRPFTDVVRAQRDPVTDRYIPVYGAPGGLRLPSFQRLDASISRARPLGGGRFAVGYAGITNVFNAGNVFGYTWSRDYAQRLEIPSSYNRSLFVGMNLSLSHTP